MPLLAQLRSIKRFGVICWILFNELVIRWPYRCLRRRKHASVIGTYLRPDCPGTSPAEIAKETLERLGPTYVKFGQFMSIRPDLIPPDFCTEFRKLQDKVPPFPFAQVRKELNRSMGRDYTEVFSELDETPLAAASVSQVHRARLKTGEEVAVKVQRPGIREEMVSDILIMLFFASILVRLMPSLRKHEPRLLVAEFSHWTDRELYFRQEGKNALHFSHNFRDEPGIRFPRVFREHTTRTVLVMEYIRGDNVLHARGDAIDRPALAGLIVDSMLKQIFIDGFFHGDPHAGNILLVDRSTIAYLDFGIVGYLSEDLRAWIFDIIYAMSRGDVPRVISSFLELCNIGEEDIDFPAYRRSMNELLSELDIYEEAGIPFSQMMKRFLYTSLEFGIPIPSEFVLVTKALTTFEGTCLTLDPEIRIVEHLRRFVQKHIARTPTPEALFEVLQTAPFEMERLKRLAGKHGAKVVKFLENPVIRLEGPAQKGAAGGDGAGESLALGLITAALIVFAGTVGDSGLERWAGELLRIPGVPVLGLTGLVAAVLLFFRLMLGTRAR